MRDRAGREHDEIFPSENAPDCTDRSGKKGQTQGARQKQDAGQGRCPKQIHNPLVSGQFFVTSLWPFGTSSTIFSSCSEPLRTDDVLNKCFVEDADAVAARRNVNAAACTTRGWLPKEVAHAEEVGGGLSAGPKHAPACLPMTDITLCCSAE